MKVNKSLQHILDKFVSYRVTRFYTLQQLNNSFITELAHMRGISLPE